MAGRSLYLESGTWNRSVWMKLNQMRKKGVGCDIELTTDQDEKLPAHLCVLAAASPYLKSLLHGIANVNKSTLIKLSGFSRQIIEVVLEFIYTGCLELHDELIDEVDKAAKALLMKDLQILCNRVRDRYKENKNTNELVILENSSWNKYVWYNLNNLRKQKLYCNLTLETNSNDKFETHACLMIAASTYFRKFLPLGKIEDGLSLCLQIEEMNIPATVMTQILDFVYVGGFSCSPRLIRSVIKTATTLKMDDLIFLLTSLCNKYNLSDKYQEEAEPEETLREPLMMEQQEEEDNNAQVVHLKEDNIEVLEAPPDPVPEPQVEVMREVAEPIQADEYTMAKVLDEVEEAENEGTAMHTSEGTIQIASLKSMLAQGPDSFSVVAGDKPGTVALLQNGQDQGIFQIQPGVEPGTFELIAGPEEGVAMEEEEQEGGQVVQGTEIEEVIEVSNTDAVHAQQIIFANQQNIMEASQMGEVGTEDEQSAVEEEEEAMEENMTMNREDMNENIIETPIEQLYAETGQPQMLDIIPNTNGKGSKCPYCFKEFRKPAEARRHLNKHTGLRPFACRKCGMSFKYRENVFQHLKVHMDVKPFKCSICDKTFRRAWDVTLHERIHTKEKPFKCPHCHKGFSQGANRHSHILRVHKGIRRQKDEETGDFECLQCGKHFATRKSLTNHEKTHTDEKPAQCEKCNAAFSSIYSLKKHVTKGRCEKVMAERQRRNDEISMQNGEQPCPYCAVIFEDFEQVREHLLTGTCLEEGDRIPQYFRDGSKIICFQCGTSFISLGGLKRHKSRGACEKNLHGGEGASALGREEEDEEAEKKLGSRVICGDCGSSFAADSGLRRHKSRGACEKVMTMHKYLPKFSCEVCGLSFSSLDAVTEHKKKEACDPSMKNVCRKCGATFKTAFALEDHVQLDICGGSDDDENSDAVMIKQEKKSPNAKQRAKVKWVCADCGSMFSNSQNLRRHKSRDSCEIAPKRKYTRKQVNVECSGCGEVFFDAAMAKKHRKNGGCARLKNSEKSAEESASSPKYMCSMCDAELDTYDDFLTHTESCSKTSEEAKTIFHQGNLDAAIQIKMEPGEGTEMNIFTESDIADRDVIREEFCVKFMSKEGKGEVNMCKICKKEFTEVIDFDSHWIADHSVKCAVWTPGGEDQQQAAGYYICPFCAFNTMEFMEFKTHIDECSDFPAGAVKSQYLYRENKTGDEEETTVVASPVKKGKTYKKMVSLLCHLCDEKFKSVESLKRHISVEHNVSDSGEGGDNTCMSCSLTFNNRDSLRKHQRKFPKGLCTKKLTTTRAVARKSLIQLNCSLCSEKFPSAEVLKWHMEKTHQIILKM